MLHVLDPKVLQADYFRQFTREVRVLVSDAHIGFVFFLILAGNAFSFAPLRLWVTLRLVSAMLINLGVLLLFFTFKIFFILDQPLASYRFSLDTVLLQEAYTTS